jgi:hypothetical protein
LPIIVIATKLLAFLVGLYCKTNLIQTGKYQERPVLSNGCPEKSRPREIMDYILWLCYAQPQYIAPFSLLNRLFSVESSSEFSGLIWGCRVYFDRSGKILSEWCTKQGGDAYWGADNYIHL